MGLFSGFRRGGEKGDKKKKLSKPAPSPVHAQNPPSDALLFSDDPYIRDKKARASGHGAQAYNSSPIWKDDIPAVVPDSWFPGRDLAPAPRLTGGGIASARSSLELLTRPWTSGNEASIPHSQSVGNAMFGRALNSSEDLRPSTANGPASKPWAANQITFASRFNAPHSQSPSLSSRSFSTSTHPRDGAQSRGNASDNEASVASSAQRSCSFDEQVSQQSPASPPSPISSVSVCSRLSDDLGATRPCPQATTTTLKAFHPDSLTETAKETAPRSKELPRASDASMPLSSPVVASATIAVNPRFIKNVRVTPGRDTKARDMAKKKDLAIKVPRRQNWSMEIEELERSWLEEQLSLSGLPPKEQNFDKTSQPQQQSQNQQQLSPKEQPAYPLSLPPRQSSRRAPPMPKQQQQHVQLQQREPSIPMPHQYRQPRPQQPKPQQAAWDDLSMSWQYPSSAPMTRQPPSAKGYQPGMRAALLSSDALPMVNQWSDRNPSGRLPYSRPTPALRGSHSMHNLSRGYQERPGPVNRTDPQGWQDYPPPRGGPSSHRGGMPPQGPRRDAQPRPNRQQAYRMPDGRLPMRGAGPYPRSPYPYSPGSPRAFNSSNVPLDNSSKGSFDFSLHGYPSSDGSIDSSSAMDSQPGHSQMSPPWRRPPPVNHRLDFHEHRSVSSPVERMPISAPPMQPRFNPEATTLEATTTATATTAPGPWTGARAIMSPTFGPVPTPTSPPMRPSPSEQKTLGSPDSIKSFQPALTEKQLSRLTIDSFPLPSPMRHRASLRRSQGPDQSQPSSPTTVASVDAKDGNEVGPPAEAGKVIQDNQSVDDPFGNGLERTEAKTESGEAEVQPELAEDEDCSFASTSVEFFDVQSPAKGEDLDKDFGKYVVGDASVDDLAEEAPEMKTPTLDALASREETPAPGSSTDEHIIRWDTPIQGWASSSVDGEGSPELSSPPPLSRPAGDAEPSAMANWPLGPCVFATAAVAVDTSRPVSPEQEADSVDASFVTGRESDAAATEADEDEGGGDPDDDEEWGLEEAVLADSPFKSKTPFTASIYRKEIGAGPYALDFPEFPPSQRGAPGGPVSVFDVSTDDSCASSVCSENSADSTPSPSPSPEKPARRVVYARWQDSLKHLTGIRRAATVSAVKPTTPDVPTMDETGEIDESEDVRRHVLSTPPAARSCDRAPEEETVTETSSVPISPESIGLARGLSICESYDMLVGVASSTAEGARSEANQEPINSAVKRDRRMAGFHHYMHSSTSLWSSSTDGMDVVDGLDGMKGDDRREQAGGLAQHTHTGHGGITAGVF